MGPPKLSSKQLELCALPLEPDIPLLNSQMEPSMVL